MIRVSTAKVSRRRSEVEEQMDNEDKLRHYLKVVTADLVQARKRSEELERDRKSVV